MPPKKEKKPRMTLAQRRNKAVQGHVDRIRGYEAITTADFGLEDKSPEEKSNSSTESFNRSMQSKSPKTSESLVTEKMFLKTPRSQLRETPGKNATVSKKPKSKTVSKKPPGESRRKKGLEKKKDKHDTYTKSKSVKSLIDQRQTRRSSPNEENSNLDNLTQQNSVTKCYNEAIPSTSHESDSRIDLEDEANVDHQDSVQNLIKLVTTKDEYQIIIKREALLEEDEALIIYFKDFPKSSNEQEGKTIPMKEDSVISDVPVKEDNKPTKNIYFPVEILKKSDKSATSSKDNTSEKLSVKRYNIKYIEEEK